MTDEIRVTVVATGLHTAQRITTKQVANISSENNNKVSLIGRLLGRNRKLDFDSANDSNHSHPVPTDQAADVRGNAEGDSAGGSSAARKKADLKNEGRRNARTDKAGTVRAGEELEWQQTDSSHGRSKAKGSGNGSAGLTDEPVVPALSGEHETAFYDDSSEFKKKRPMNLSPGNSLTSQ